MTHQMLTRDLNLKETIRELPRFELPPVSRFKLGSPCLFIRSLDIFIHIFIPEVVEKILPHFARYLRNTSPRWGRSWRHW